MSTPTITAAYVWQCATDFRANVDIADTASIIAGPQSLTVVLRPGDTDSLTAAVLLIEGDQPLSPRPDVHSQPYGDDEAIVAVSGTYRGVYIGVQARVAAGHAQALVAELEAAIDTTAGQVA